MTQADEEKRFRRRRRAIEEHNEGERLDSSRRGGLKGIRSRITQTKLDKVFGEMDEDE